MTIEDWKIYWVGFNLVKGIGPIRFRNLIDHFGDANTAWHASRSDLEAAGIHTKIIDNLWLVKQSGELERIWNVILKSDIQLLTWDDARYPRGLREIDQSPPVLYLHGEFNRRRFSCSCNRWDTQNNPVRSTGNQRVIIRACPTRDNYRERIGAWN